MWSLFFFNIDDMGLCFEDGDFTVFDTQTDEGIYISLVNFDRHLVIEIFLLVLGCCLEKGECAVVVI